MNWQSFKSLYELYSSGKTATRPSLVNDAVFKYHTSQTKELLITKRDIIVNKQSVFENTFSSRYLSKYNVCLNLLNAINENTPQCKFDVDDILTLAEMKQQMDNGELEEIRNQIIESNETRRGVSLMFFKHDKHLDASEALERAVKTILKVEMFPDNRDFQYLYVLHCHSPIAIVLCENLHFLKMPGKARNSHIELWYAGGRNVEKLTYTSHRQEPIYYICDWDYDGLDIFRTVKAALPGIKLLTPNGRRMDIVKSEHRSLWMHRENPSVLAGLPPLLFTDKQKEVIESLIMDNAWIVEESNDLIALMAQELRHC